MIELEFLQEKQFEKEKIANLLECSENELAELFDDAKDFLKENQSIYQILLKILQQGYNVREATLIGLICGQLIGYSNAEEKIEDEIKERLFQAFKNSNS